MKRRHPPHLAKGTGRSPLERLLQWSADLPRRTATINLGLIWIALFAADAATGRHVSLNGLYLLPLCFTAWCLGSGAALAWGGVATILTLLMNGFGDGLSAQASTISPATATWNAGMRIFSVVFLIMLVGAFRRVFDRERADARVDPLTKLSNRRAFDIDSRRLEASCARDGRLLLCGLIDVDDFKLTNDHFGHAAGDQMLVAIADALVDAVRSYDVTARLGGDEFAFCLSVRNEDAAKRTAEKIHRQISAALDALPWPASCSIGAATGRNAASTLSRADGLMYTVKSAGKGMWLFTPQGAEPVTGQGSPGRAPDRPADLHRTES